MSTKLYAWAANVKFLPGVTLRNAEHTWVTSYSPGTGAPDESKGYYWPCNGAPREEALCIGIGEGGVEFAMDIATPFRMDDHVGIRYGKDGVCHQMANRLLRFSLNENSEPLKVTQAKGYQMSVAMYGEYGGKFLKIETQCKEEWERRVEEYESLQRADQ